MEQAIASSKTVEEVAKAARRLREIIQFHLDDFEKEFLCQPRIYTTSTEAHHKCGLTKENRVIVEVYF